MEGDLGAGKTTMTKGIALGLGIKDIVNSPTFTIMKTYKGRLDLYHLDVYRINDPYSDFELEEYFESNGLCVIEWASQIEPILPDELLQKATPLTDEERDTIKNHPVIAAREILKPISYVQDVLPIIEHHHENWDGSGYPNKMSKEEIPLTSQIILILDQYFALIEPRPYRAKLSTRDALEIIKADAGKKWNNTLVNEFISLIEHDIV
jgi:tRNA threonylcarbamoyladenosine biosynthesis protein TsaE